MTRTKTAKINSPPKRIIIPRYMLQNIERIFRLRNQATNIEKEVLSWFESKGIDTWGNSFTDAVGDKICYGEYDYVEQIQEMLDEFLELKAIPTRFVQ